MQDDPADVGPGWSRHFAEASQVPAPPVAEFARDARPQRRRPVTPATAPEATYACHSLTGSNSQCNEAIARMLTAATQDSAMQLLERNSWYQEQVATGGHQ